MTRFFQILSWCPPSTDHLGGTLDRFENADVRAATALEAGERILDLGLRRFFLVAEESGGRHEPAVDAVAALRHLLLDIGGLQWMWLFRCPKPRKRRDLGVADGRYRGDARAGRL